MPNRILVKGSPSREAVKNILLKEWQKVLQICREWVVNQVGIPEVEYAWSQKLEQQGKQKGEWERWGCYTWEFFWGTGASPEAAMQALEAGKLKRDWTGINWTGESSSLTGTDAIAWHRLGEENHQPWQLLNEADLAFFYRRLAWVLDHPRRNLQAPLPSRQELAELEVTQPDEFGKYIAPNERLSIPELVKRLVTYDKIAEAIGMEKLKKSPNDSEFRDIIREPGYWTGWFLGDGDKVGNQIKAIANRAQDDATRDRQLQQFTELMRCWGQHFEQQPDLFPQGKGRVIYAGGDDFLGVLYSEEPETEGKRKTGEAAKPEKVRPQEAMDWLLRLDQQWNTLQTTLRQTLDVELTFSVGFVWAGHAVPQRDILQHCRASEKRSKALGRDRLTIRVVFNSGRFVQWTCPWKDLTILTHYRDRYDMTGAEANWNHLYSDWAQLKARHAVRLDEMEGIKIHRQIALSLFDLYFDGAGTRFWQQRRWQDIAGDNSDRAIVNWINDLVEIGWQLCRNSNT